MYCTYSYNRNGVCGNVSTQAHHRRIKSRLFTRMHLWQLRAGACLLRYLARLRCRAAQTAQTLSLSKLLCTVTRAVRHAPASRNHARPAISADIHAKIGIYPRNSCGGCGEGRTERRDREGEHAVLKIELVDESVLRSSVA